MRSPTSRRTSRSRPPAYTEPFAAGPVGRPVKARLQKLLAEAGLASRRGAEDWIRAGRVQVNGEVARLGDSADPARDDVRVDGRPLRAEPHQYWLLHKPRGVLTTVADPWAGPTGRRTVLELLPSAARRTRLYPVGRLDLDSEGLLLLTNDGDTAQALLHPSRGCEREYRVDVRGQVEPATADRLARGVELEDGPTRPCRVRVLGHDRARDATRLVLTLREGRKRQIRRALRALGHPVRRLVRTRMGPLRLGTLAPGRARRLDARERGALLRFARGDSATGKTPASRTRRSTKHAQRRTSRGRIGPEGPRSR